MTPHDREIDRREQAARKRIAEAADGTEDGDAVTMFVEHHLSEIEPTYWIQHFGQPKPPRDTVIKGLVLRGHWSDDEEEGIDEDGLDVLDFTLPGEVTQYQLAVYFMRDGTVNYLTMES